MNKDNMRAVLRALEKSNIENEHLQVAIMCVIAKECNFRLITEMSYINTSNKRCRKIFSVLREMNDTMLMELKKNKVLFFEKVYGGRNGNTRYGDGYLYRGRGFNQLTFKDNYAAYSNEHFDLVAHPELLSSAGVAAYVVVEYFSRQLDIHSTDMIKRYGMPDNDDTAIWICANLNAGAGRGKDHQVVVTAHEHATMYLSKIRKFYNAEDKELLIKNQWDRNKKEK